MNEVSLLLLLAERISLPARLTLRTLLETWRISPGLPRSPQVSPGPTRSDDQTYRHHPGYCPHLNIPLSPNCIVIADNFLTPQDYPQRFAFDFLSDFIRED